jgi:hypothetical protein
VERWSSSCSDLGLLLNGTIGTGEGGGESWGGSSGAGKLEDLQSRPSRAT